MAVKSNLDETLESIRRFCAENGVTGAAELYEVIDVEVRKTLDANNGANMGALTQMYINIFVGFTSSLCAYFAAHVVEEKREAFIDKFQDRFMAGVRDCVPELVEGLVAKLKEDDDEHIQNTRVGGLH